MTPTLQEEIIDFYYSAYYKYMQMYQQRYVPEWDIPITWRIISHWRKTLDLYGKLLIEAGIMSIAEHKKNKANIVILDSKGNYIDIFKQQQLIPL